jgi:CRISPR system Cascade subunit CasE
MILSRFFLNGASRDVHRCLADSHHLHARVLSMFPAVAAGPARAELGVLHRLEVAERQGTITLLVQSRDAPDATRLPDAFLDPHAGADAASSTPLAPLLDALAPGARYRFRLRANPTRKIDTKSGPDGTRRNGRRVPVRGDEERLAWLGRKLAAAGLAVVTESVVRQAPQGVTRGRREAGVATHDAHVFEGVVDVVDAALAREAINRGIGSGKAYGFGLLSLARL